MQDGTRRDVELACGLVVWPARTSKMGRMGDIVMINLHLPATEDEALLRRWDTRLLLHFLLDPIDLYSKAVKQSKDA